MGCSTLAGSTDEKEAPPLPNGAPAGCWFDHEAAKKACDFFPRYLRHTEGEWAGQPFVLTPWERHIVRHVFGWKLPDGSRLTRTLYLEIGRKNGKTEFVAGLAVLLLVGDGEFGGQGYSAAVDKDQARLVFNKAGVMVGFSEELGRHIEVMKASLYCAELMASFKPISSTPGSKHGFSPSFGIYDEIHAMPDGELVDVVHKGMAARRQPFEVYTTTAGIKYYGYGWEMHDRAVKIASGLLVDPSFLAVIYAAGDEDDWREEATWAKANPGMGVSPKIEFLRAECAKAQGNPRLENEFRRYHLNQWTEKVTRWLALDAWDACTGDVPWQKLEAALARRSAFAAVDLSSKVDLSALTLTFAPAEEDGLWHYLCRFFMPEERVEFAEKRDRLPYRDWIRTGALMTTPGNIVDYAFIEKQLMDDAARFAIRETAYDAWNATHFATRMAGEGMTMVDFRQGYQSMTEPSKFYEALVISHRLRHGGHPVLREMAKAVSVSTDPSGNIKPDKSKMTLHIDGIVSSIMGTGRAMVVPAEQPSVYETRGIRYLEAI